MNFKISAASSRQNISTFRVESGTELSRYKAYGREIMSGYYVSVLNIIFKKNI